MIEKIAKKKKKKSDEFEGILIGGSDMQEELRSPKVLTLETESGDVMKNAHI